MRKPPPAYHPVHPGDDPLDVDPSLRGDDMDEGGYFVMEVDR